MHRANTLNMGQDIHRWKEVAKQAKKSPNREEKRKWLRALHKVLVKELKTVVADDDADDVFKASSGGSREDPASVARSGSRCTATRASVGGWTATCAG